MSLLLVNDSYQFLSAVIRFIRCYLSFKMFIFCLCLKPDDLTSKVTDDAHGYRTFTVAKRAAQHVLVITYFPKKLAVFWA